MSTETLSPEVGWERDHLSEVALSVLADGEDTLLDAAMHAHLGTCDECAQALGRVAMRSAVVAETFAEARANDVRLLAASDARQVAPMAAAPVVTLGKEIVVPAAAPGSIARERRKIPVVAMAGALVVALLGAAPSLLSAPLWAKHTWSVAREVAPLFLRLLPQALARAWSGPRGSFVVLSWGLAIGLVAIGLVIAKQASKKAILDGGRR